MWVTFSCQVCVWKVVFQIIINETQCISSTTAGLNIVYWLQPLGISCDSSALEHLVGDPSVIFRPAQL